VIEIDGLTRHYRSRVAVDDLTVTIHPGRVTGFLGPNGSGKTTTMRCILGLTRPTSGTATVLGRPYRELAQPMRRVGALIDPHARHPGRTAYRHLLALAQSNGLPAARVDEVIELVGLEAVADDRVSGSASPPHSSATPTSCCSTNRSTGWTPRASAGCADCCASWPTRAAPCWSPAT
jgi:ABC-2 type transport system ATP-binding protein